MDACDFASPVLNDANSQMDGSDGRMILKELTGLGQLNHPPARPAFGCYVSKTLLNLLSRERKTPLIRGMK